MQKFDRKPVMLISLAITTLCAQLVVTLGFWVDARERRPYLLPLLLLNAAGFTFSIGMG
ncbi:MAG: hypothetical protein CM15mP120_15680 [Pseudomonadota bacterium]|nr:MAG: hypothetical protein CM15mP120_15680 [Pseudomonadota bacterium]